MVFVRAPQRGKVKTRLAKQLDEAVVVELYQKWVIDILSVLNPIKRPVIICGHPEEKLSEIKVWLGENYDYIPQVGSGLGEKMKCAFRELFDDGYEQLVLIGSDIPEISASIVEEAFTALSANKAVIGPTKDGGYYLIGFNTDNFSPEIFDDISWSTERVFAQTMAVFERLRRTVYLLPLLRDIDEFSDLIDFFDTAADDTAVNTRRYLSGIAPLTGRLNGRPKG